MKLAAPSVRLGTIFCMEFHSGARDRAHNGIGRLSVCIYIYNLTLVILKLQLRFTFFDVHTNYEMQVLTGWVSTA